VNNRHLLAALVSCLPVGVFAQSQASPPTPETQPTELAIFDLENSLNAKTQVASQKAMTVRESPGVLTVITREEIVQSGARDLLDILVLVPGFAPALDVEGVVDVGIRGAWAHEGKVLLLIDGVEQNETLYASLQLGNHYPVDQIQSIEIIRGPGSAEYGGYAELAVINIHTRTPSDLNGVSISGTYGELPRGLGRRDLSFYGGAVVPSADGLQLSLTGMVGQGNRSDRVYTDQLGNSFDMANSSELDPLFLDLGLRYKGLHTQVIYDNYRAMAQDSYSAALPTQDNQAFRSLFVSADYTYQPISHLKLVPRFDYKLQMPWYDGNVASVQFYEKTAERTTGKLTGTYDLTDELFLSAGAEVYVDYAKLDSPLLIGSQTQFGGKNSVEYTNEAIFAEGGYDSFLGNLVVGARYEHNSAVGGSFVPRVAFTKAIRRFHFKLLYAGAFRAPAIEDINTSAGNLRPEKTWVGEAELGYQLSDHWYLAVNAFDIRIESPIVYSFDPSTQQQDYFNAPRMGTRGVEVDGKVKYGWGYADLNYSFYTAGGQGQVDIYSVPGHPDALLAFPQHKVALNASIHLWRTLSLNPSGVFVSTRYGYPTTDASGVRVLQGLGPAAFLNLYLLYKDLGIPGLDLGVGVFNLLNVSNPYIQAYNGGHAPLPGPTRELMARLSYTRPF
jgi:outer membrane receptor for ferrienterochelin and colicin